jgi:hypothetical protein
MKSKMLMLVNDIPEFCPKCGQALSSVHHPSAILDAGEFFDSVSFIHKPCGTRYQYVRTDKLLQSAQDAGGDLAKLAYSKPKNRQ